MDILFVPFFEVLLEVLQIPLRLVNFLFGGLAGLFDEMVEQDEFVIFPVEKENPVRQWAQFPNITLNMFDLWLTDTGAKGFQRTDVGQYFFGTEYGHPCWSNWHPAIPARLV